MNSESDDRSIEPAPDIVAAQEDIVETFSFFEEWSDRYQYIIDLGKQLDDFPESEKTEANRLKGCQSQVWLIHELRDGVLHFDAASDSTIVSGLIALLLSVYSERPPADILRTPPEFIKEIELDRHLSPTRSNGLGAMVQQIRQRAVEVLAGRA